MNLSNNDDDLFDYDPQKDLKTSSLDDSSSQEDVVFSVDSLTFSSTASSAFAAISSVASRFFNSQELVDDSFRSSVSKFLDELTDGKFSKNFIFNILEKDIIKKKALISFNQLFISILNSESSSLKIFKSEDSDSLMDLQVLNKMIQSSLEISFHSVKNDILTYRKLSEDLQIECNPLVFADFLIDSSDIQDIINTQIDYEIFHSHINSLAIHTYSSEFIDIAKKIYTDLIDDELLQNLSINEIKPFIC
jgi:hypothetical protein